MRMYLIGNLSMSPSAYAFVTSMAAVPWALKPIIGAAVDCNPYRRSSILACGFGISLPWAIIASGAVTHAVAISVLIIVSSACLCYADVTADAILVPYVRRESTEDMGKLQSSCWIARAAGAVVAGIAGGTIVYAIPARTALYIMTAMGVPTCLCIYGIATDITAPTCAVVKIRAKRVKLALSGPNLFKPCIFIFALCAMPSYGATLMVFFQTELRFSPGEFAVIDVAGHLAHALGACLYKYKLRHASFSRIFTGGICFDIVLQAIMIALILRVNVSAHIPDLALALCETVSTAIISQVMMMPICLLAARTCPRNIEATLYSTIMAISNLGGLCAMLSGAWLTDIFDIHVQHFGKLWQLAVICLMASFLPLTCVRFMANDPTKLTVDEEQGEIELTPCPDGSYSDRPVASGPEQDSPTDERHTQQVAE